MRVPIVGSERGSQPRRSAWRRLHAPDDMVEATRLLLLVLAGLSLGIAVVAPVAAREKSIPLLGVAAALVLIVSWRWAYSHRSAPLLLDVLDSVAILAFAVACPSPTVSFGVLFGALWFKALYGSTRQAVVRCTMYSVALVLGVVVSARLPGYPASDAALLIGAIPTMYVTLVVGRHLSVTTRARSEAARRSEVQALLSSQLLAVSEAAEVYEVAWTAANGLCAATPGLRVLLVVGAPAALRVDGAAGFVTRPVTVGPDLLALPPTTSTVRSREIGTSAALDAAAGATCAWVCMPLPVLSPAGDNAWMIIGAPKRVPAEAIVSFTSLANQVSLAMINGQTARELTVLGTLDGLTRLANRAAFQAATSAALEAEPAGETTVLFVALDDFKDVNDLLGHSAGDEVLREVAARLQHATRPSDLCARLGGDEFAVLLRNTGLDVATDVADRIVRSVSAPAQLQAGVAHVGASVGVAMASHDTPLEDLVHRADVAMYAAKANGKGRVQVFGPGLLHRNTTQGAFDRQLGAALRNCEIAVHYQPIVSLGDGRCTGVEALARWHHPERGLVLPGDFMAAAERTGAIRGIGRQVLRQACSDAAEWRRDASWPLSVHVNVSAGQLDDDDFVATVLTSLREYGLPAKQLVLEVTETVTLSSAMAIERLNALAGLGVSIALDDFGTGYSALTTLRTLPVGIVKIDRSFIAGSTLNAEDRVVTETVVTVAAQMGMETVAEGVERPDQLAYLRSIGTTAAQGYLFLRPSTADEFGSWLSAHRLAARDDLVGAVVVPFAAPAARRSR